MKKLYLIIFTLITLCGELSAQHVPVLVGRVISKQMALERIKSLFAGQEVDYYVGEALANIEQHPGDMPPIGPLMLRSNSFLIILPIISLIIAQVCRRSLASKHSY